MNKLHKSVEKLAGATCIRTSFRSKTWPTHLRQVTISVKLTSNRSPGDAVRAEKA